jgi:hypothetical protein
MLTSPKETGIILYVNKALIIWYSKRQNTVESATFGSEFIALKTAIDQIDGLRYKLRMFAIPLYGPKKSFVTMMQSFVMQLILNQRYEESIHL